MINKRSLFFPEIVGLRLYLATWVALGHGLQLSGFLRPEGPVTGFLLTTDAPVYVFMIISGFVITNLIDGKNERYLVYIFRRFVRLYPAYLLCCGLGFVLMVPWVQFARSTGWLTVPGWPSYVAGVASLLEQQTFHLVPHAALHFLMLHGLVPNEVLEKASTTFLPAAWSISLEWQFYIIAPILIWLTRRHGPLVVTIVVSVTLYYAYRQGFLGTYDEPSTIAGTVGYFGIGIGSRLAYPTLRALNPNAIVAASVSAAMVVLFVQNPLPLVIWAAFFSLMIGGGLGEPLLSAYRWLTTARPIALLGEASYSLYLVHRPVQVLFAIATLAWVGHSRQSIMLSQIAAIAAALVLSVGIYLCVELPFINLAKRFVRRPTLQGGLTQDVVAAKP